MEQLGDLINQLDEVSQKLTDQEYKSLVETISEIRKEMSSKERPNSTITHTDTMLSHRKANEIVLLFNRYYNTYIGMDIDPRNQSKEWLYIRNVKSEYSLRIFNRILDDLRTIFIHCEKISPDNLAEGVCNRLWCPDFQLSGLDKNIFKNTSSIFSDSEKIELNGYFSQLIYAVKL